MHDARGNAKLEWEDAPSDYVRPVLEIVEDGRSERADENTFNPYARKAPRPSTGNTTRTDLRKLSEWIKQMRELEQRRLKGDAVDGPDDQDSQD